MRSFDLRTLRFDDAGEAWRVLPVEVAPFIYGGLVYEAPGGEVETALTVARVGDSLTLTAELTTSVGGPCQRCLDDAHVPVTARGVEYVRHGESETDDEAYAVGHVLDVERWIRDLIAEALPPKLLCRDDCRGVCPACGANLNDAPEHSHEEA